MSVCRVWVLMPAVRWWKTDNGKEINILIVDRLLYSSSGYGDVTESEDIETVYYCGLSGLSSSRTIDYSRSSLRLTFPVEGLDHRAASVLERYFETLIGNPAFLDTRNFCPSFAKIFKFRRWTHKTWYRNKKDAHLGAISLYPRDLGQFIDLLYLSTSLSISCPRSLGLGEPW